MHHWLLGERRGTSGRRAAYDSQQRWCVLLFGPAAPVGLIRGRAAPDNGRARATMWTAPLMLGGGEMRLPPDDGLPEQRQVTVAWLYAVVVVAGSAARISLLVRRRRNGWRRRRHLLNRSVVAAKVLAWSYAWGRATGLTDMMFSPRAT